MSIMENQQFVAFVGTNFGGDGTTTFAPPDSAWAGIRAPSAQYCIALEGIFPSRD